MLSTLLNACLVRVEDITCPNVVIACDAFIRQIDVGIIKSRVAINVVTSRTLSKEYSKVIIESRVASNDLRLFSCDATT